MKWTITELLREGETLTFDEEMEIDAGAFAQNSGIHGVKDVRADGSGYLDDDETHFYLMLHVSGTMICPDSITNEEIEVPFDTESEEVYCFEESDEDGVRIVTDEVIDTYPAVVDAILLEVPLQVTEAAEGNYPQGDGWRIMSEAEYQESRKDQIDPRLAKLKQFNEEK